MPNMSAAEFKERLTRDLPDALAPTHPRAHLAGNGASDVPTRGKRAEEGPPDLLVTEDAVVQAERLPEVAVYVRDQLGYDLLSNVTAVDYLADGMIEMVYHFLHLSGGSPLVVKTRVPRELPVVPSLTSFWPGADLQEREAYDLYGVRFPGHPNLMRVYMWEEFEGHPMRKDFPKQGDKYLGDDEEV